MVEILREEMNKKKKFARIVAYEYGKVFLVGLLLVGIIWATYTLMMLTTSKGLVVTFFDVGQGDSIFIQTPSGHDMLIDGGATDAVVEELSKTMKYFDRHIDVVLATHPDADHITGLIPVLKKYSVDTILTSPISGGTGIAHELTKNINLEHATTHVAKKGDVIDFGDGVVVKILYPKSDTLPVTTETNDASVSLLLVYGSSSVLLTGDLPTTYESELLTSVLPRKITIYKAGHHGSKYSSGEQLLSYIRPEYTVISAGKNNKYGHPNPEALSRLQLYSQEIMSTIDKGTISFILDDHVVRVNTEH